MPLSGTAFFYTHMSHTVFLDESGDLGFKFTAPYRAGGSSRHLTMGFIVVPDTKKHLLKRIVRRVYSKYGFSPGSEIKGSSFNLEQKDFVARQLNSLISKNPDILLSSITVKKENVELHIRNDSNLLYNYMMRLSVIDHIKHYSLINLIRDNKTVKIASGNTLVNYLQTTLWFECKVETILKDIPSDSKSVLGLILVDWLNNIVFHHYEMGNSNAFNIIQPVISNKRLFF